MHDAADIAQLLPNSLDPDPYRALAHLEFRWNINIGLARGVILAARTAPDRSQPLNRMAMIRTSDLARALISSSPWTSAAARPGVALI